MKKLHTELTFIAQIQHIQHLTHPLSQKKGVTPPWMRFWAIWFEAKTHCQNWEEEYSTQQLIVL